MFSLTKHGSIREAQRIKGHDLKIINNWASEVFDGYLMRECDCQAAERALKKPPGTFHRLKGIRVVVKDGWIVTVFHASEREVRRILRRTDERCLEQAA